jgi:hypothetical protein
MSNSTLLSDLFGSPSGAPSPATPRLPSIVNTGGNQPAGPIRIRDVDAGQVAQRVSPQTQAQIQSLYQHASGLQQQIQKFDALRLDSSGLRGQLQDAYQRVRQLRGDAGSSFPGIVSAVQPTPSDSTPRVGVSSPDALRLHALRVAAAAPQEVDPFQSFNRAMGIGVPPAPAPTPQKSISDQLLDWSRHPTGVVSNPVDKLSFSPAAMQDAATNGTSYVLAKSGAQIPLALAMQQYAEATGGIGAVIHNRTPSEVEEGQAASANPFRALLANNPNSPGHTGAWLTQIPAKYLNHIGIHEETPIIGPLMHGAGSVLGGIMSTPYTVAKAAYAVGTDPIGTALHLPSTGKDFVDSINFADDNLTSTQRMARLLNLASVAFGGYHGITSLIDSGAIGEIGTRFGVPRAQAELMAEQQAARLAGANGAGSSGFGYPQEAAQVGQELTSGRSGVESPGGRGLRGHIMVSPNTGPPMPFEQAVENLTSQEHVQGKLTAEEIAQRRGLKGSYTNAIGDWHEEGQKPGAENTLIGRFDEHHSLHEIWQAAAETGRALGQIDTIAVKPTPNGTKALLTFDFPADHFTEPAVRKLLDDNGFRFRTIESSENNIRAIIYVDNPETKEFGDNAERVADYHPGITYTLEPVDGGFLTGANNRADARTAYDRILGGALSAVGDQGAPTGPMEGTVGYERDDHRGNNPSRGSPQAIQRATSQGSRGQGQTLTLPRPPNPYAVYMLAKGGTQPQTQRNQKFPSRSPSADPLEGPYRALLGLDNR